VTDHCRAIEAVITKGKVGETYNVGGNCERSNLEIVMTICSLLDEKKPSAIQRSYTQLITHVQDRPGHDRRYAMDTSRICQELGWRALENMHSGLNKTVDWYLANLDWCQVVGGDSATIRRGLDTVLA